MSSAGDGMSRRHATCRAQRSAWAIGSAQLASSYASECDASTLCRTVRRA